MAGKGHPAPSGTGRKLLSTVPLYFYFSLDSGFSFRHTSLVNDALLVQGRQVTESNLQEIRELLAAHPDWSRRRLSEALCEQWNWCNGAGLRKDMAARTLDRKSTRLNSSHGYISYAVFCLKKKKKTLTE